MSALAAEQWHKKYGIGKHYDHMGVGKVYFHSTKQAGEFLQRHGKPGESFREAVLRTAIEHVKNERPKITVTYLEGGNRPPEDGLHQGRDVLIFER